MHKLIVGIFCAALMMSAPLITQTSAAFADTPNTSNPAAIDQLNELLHPMSAFSARFEQRITDGQGIELQTVKGMMEVMRPGRFIWISDDPFPQQIVSNGSTLWIYDQDLDQVTVQQLDNKVGNTPALLLSGDPKKITDSFIVSKIGVDTPSLNTASLPKQEFTLIPKNKDALFETLSVTFEGKVLAQMSLLDGLGNRTRITFSQMQVNPTFQAKRFEFEIPADVDVISDAPR